MSLEFKKCFYVTKKHLYILFLCLKLYLSVEKTCYTVLCIIRIAKIKHHPLLHLQCFFVIPTIKMMIFLVSNAFGLTNRYNIFKTKYSSAYHGKLLNFHDASCKNH